VWSEGLSAQIFLIRNNNNERDLSLLGDVILQERLGVARLSVVLDDSARALDNLLGLSFAVELAEAYPLAQLLAFRHAEDWDGMLFGECLHQADILSRVAVLRQDAQVRLPNDVNTHIQTYKRCSENSVRANFAF
jgi:hypothetical protein